MSKTGLILALALSAGAAIATANTASNAKAILDAMASRGPAPAPSGTVRLAERGSFGPPPGSYHGVDRPAPPKRKATASKPAPNVPPPVPNAAKSSWAAEPLTAPDTGQTN